MSKLPPIHGKSLWTRQIRMYTAQRERTPQMAGLPDMTPRLGHSHLPPQPASCKSPSTRRLGPSQAPTMVAKLTHGVGVSRGTLEAHLLLLNSTLARSFSDIEALEEVDTMAQGQRRVAMPIPVGTSRGMPQAIICILYHTDIL